MNPSIAFIILIFCANVALNIVVGHIMIWMHKRERDAELREAWGADARMTRRWLDGEVKTLPKPEKLTR